jgi:putative membrane protein
VPVALICAAVAYVAGVRRLRRPWNPWRTTAYFAGLLSLAVALVLPHDERFTLHMAQHMLLGMLGPVFLALSAPVTLALRTLPRPTRNLLVRGLHSRAASVLAHPVTATALFVGGIVGLYFTPVYEQTLHHPLLHELVHLHFLAAGCVFAWAFIGADPVPRRGSFPFRAGLLLFALGAHAALAKLLYAGYGQVVDPQAGAQLMYYGGDAVDVIVLVAFFGRWYAAGGRRLAHARRQPLTTPIGRS